MRVGGGLLGRFGHERRAFGIVVSLALLIKLLEFQGWLAPTEGRIFDSAQGVRRGTAAQARNDVAVVLVDDEDYRNCFQSQSPLNPDRVMALVREFGMGSAVVGVDIFTEGVEYGKHRSEGGLKAVWAAKANDPVAMTADFFQWLMGHEDHFSVTAGKVLGEPAELESPARLVTWGIPLYPRDEDLRVRRFPREVTVRDSVYQAKEPVKRASWAKQIADRSGLRVPERPSGWAKWLVGHDEGGGEVMISFDRPDPVKRRVSEFFSCSPKAFVSKGTAAELVASHKIILIGGTFGGLDEYETPVGRKPGVVISAAALQSEIDNRVIHEIPRLATFIMDIGFGWLLILLGIVFPPRKDAVRALFRRSAALILVLIVLSWFLLGAGYVWFSWIVVAAGTLLGLLVDIWRMNPQVKHEG